MPTVRDSRAAFNFIQILNGFWEKRSFSGGIQFHSNFEWILREVRSYGDFMIQNSRGIGLLLGLRCRFSICTLAHATLVATEAAEDGWSVISRLWWWSGEIFLDRARDYWMSWRFSWSQFFGNHAVLSLFLFGAISIAFHHIPCAHIFSKIVWLNLWDPAVSVVLGSIDRPFKREFWAYIAELCMSTNRFSETTIMVLLPTVHPQYFQYYSAESDQLAPTGLMVTDRFVDDSVMRWS
jgi:hypothetical protein